MKSGASWLLAPISPRRSFAAKLGLSFLAAVGLLLLITLLAVRQETSAQVELVSQRAVESARTAFDQLEDFRREQLGRVAAPLTEGIRAFAALEELIQAGDEEGLLQNVTYELERNQMDPAGILLVFTDPAGRALLTYAGGEVVEGEDPGRISPVVAALAESASGEASLYRVLGGRLYNVQVRLLQLGGGPPVGAVALGFPIEDREVARIGLVAGVEVCFVVAGDCVAATPYAKQNLAPALVSMAGVEEPVTAEGAGRTWKILSEPLSRENAADGSRVVAVPLEGVLAPFDRIRRTLLLSGLATLLLAILLSSALGRGLTRPVRALVAATGRVARGDLNAEVPVTSADELGTLASAFNEMTLGLRLKERYRGVLDKVVSREVAEELVKGEVVLGGENRVVTMLFADVRGFTALTEGMEPQRVIGLINECMEFLSAAVDAEGGVVDKYVGDELMAVFGAPVGRPDDALRAARAALRMQQGMAELNRSRAERSEAPLGLGIGLNTGTVVAGNMGSQDRLNYTVLGDAVNLAARLCSGAGRGEILVTGETIGAAERSGARLTREPLGGRSFKGFSADFEVYLLTGIEEGARERADAAASPRTGGTRSAAGVSLSGGASSGST